MENETRFGAKDLKGGSWEPQEVGFSPLRSQPVCWALVSLSCSVLGTALHLGVPNAHLL